LLPRDGASDDVRWIEIEPCFVFHTLGGYEDDGRVVVDLCRYDRLYDVAKLRGPGPLTLDRWIIDPAGGKLTAQRLDDRKQEFPRVDERRIGRSYRYGYTAVIGAGTKATLSLSGDVSDDEFSNALLKHDLSAGTVQPHEFGRDAAVGEAVFAPAKPDGAEDDGYVLAFVNDPQRGAADLVILAAHNGIAKQTGKSIRGHSARQWTKGQAVGRIHCHRAPRE
jgi:carotenoid cleavage dioxygenase